MNMTGKNLISSTRAHPLLLAAVIGGIGLLLALAARLRNGTAAHADVTLPPLPAPEAQPPSSVYVEQEGKVVRLLFALILILSLIIPWFLPRQVASTLFIALVIASVAVAVWSAPVRTREVLQLILRWPRRIGRALAFPLVRVYTLLLAVRASLSVALSWSAIGLVAFSAYILLPEHGIERLDKGARYALLGGIVLGASLWLTPQKGALRSVSMPCTVETRPDTASRPRWSMVVWGALGLFLLAEISGNLLYTHLLSAASHHVQLVILCVSLVLLTWGLGSGRSSTGAYAGGCGRTLLDRLGEISILLAVTTFAFVLRWWQLGEAVHFFVDEVNFVSAVLEFRTTNHVPLLSPFSGITAFPWLFPYLQSQAVNLFGRDLEGLRAVSAIMGTLTIPALYLLAKTLFDRKTALLAALLLATFPPHIHFSRLGINNIADPLFGTLALAFLARGLMTHRRMDYVVGGVMLGLTQYFYEGGRLLYPPLVVLWLALGALLWRRTRQAMSLHVRGLAPTGLAALVVAFPIYYSLLGVNAPVAARLSDAGLRPHYWQNLVDAASDPNVLQAHITHLKWAFAVYVNLPDSSLFYGGDQPLLLSYIVPAFLLGVFYALWRLRSPGALLLVLWVLLASLGNSLLIESTHSARFVVVFPALALLVAVGVRYTLPLAGLNRLPGKIRYTLIGLLVAAFVVGQVAYYFGPHLEKYRRDSWYSRTSHDGQDAAFRSVGFPPGTQVHLVTREVYQTINDDMTILGFLADGVQMDALLARDLDHDALDSLPLYVSHAFFIEPGDLSTLHLLRQHFTLEGPQFSPWNVPMSRQFVLYYAPHWLRPRR